MTHNNPFQLVYDTLWSMLEEDSRFQIKEGNKLKFNIREPLKTQHTTSDYPEVMLVAESLSGNLCNTSSTSMLVKRFSWVISVGDYRYSEIFPIEWAVFTGMLAWRYRLKPLLWDGYEFVKCLRLVDSNIDQNIERARAQGISGWISVWTIEVEMHFANELIRGTHLA